MTELFFDLRVYEFLRKEVENLNGKGSLDLGLIEAYYTA